MAKIEGEDSITSGIVERGKEQKRTQQSIEEAKSLSPSFKENILNLFKPHFKRHPGDLSEKQLKRMKFGTRINKTYGIIEQRVELSCKMLVEEQTVEATIFCSQYPVYKTPMKYAEYKIDVSDLDHVLVVYEDKVTLVSKERESSMPKDFHHVVIGKKYDSWPAWTRPATTDDIQKFQNFLDSLRKNKTVYTPHIYPRRDPFD